MPPSIKHITPVEPNRAEGLVGKVYSRAKAELGVIGAPIMMLSPAEELLAPLWSLLRESLLVGGPEERKAKEIVATTIAVKNRCRFCTDAHTLMLHAVGEPEAAEAVRSGRPPREWADLAAWAAAPSLNGPFEADAAPRFIGTALVFELITRLVKALATNESPHAVMATKLGRSVASRQMRELVSADLEPGRSLPLLLELPDWSKDVGISEPAWAADSPVGTAYATLRGRAAYGSMLLSDQAAEAVQRTVGRYDATLLDRLPLLAGAADLPDQAGLGAQIAAAAALAPDSITEADVTAWRGETFTDHCVAYLLTFGAMTVVDAVQDEIGIKGNVDA